MFDKMKEIYELQKKAREIQKKLENVKVEKEENGIKIKINGIFKVETIAIDPSFLAIDRKEKLENTLARLFSSAVQEAQKQSALESKDLLKGLSL